MASTYIVFGGSGFIGTHLMKRLVAGGHTVISADRRPPAVSVAGVEYRTADVRDLSAFEVPAGTARIYNLAAVHTTPGHPDPEYYDTNIAGAVEITALAERAGIQDIVFTSSISVYGPGEETRTEDSRLKPVSAYGWSKMLAERVHRAWQQRDPRHKLVVVRPAVVFGPGEGGNFTRLAALLKKGFFVYPGRKDTIKACIYVDDLIDAIEYAAAKSDPYILFNGSYPQQYTLEQIVEAMIREYFPGVRTVMVPRAAVKTAATALRSVNALNIGIHPDRVEKLVRSTDVYPKWLVAEGFGFPDALNEALRRWADATNRRFD
jgi:nucleoside-diphosphate-sugar epimerase